MAGLANLYKQNSNTKRQQIQYLTCHLRFIPFRNTKLHWDTKSFRPRVLCTCSFFKEYSIPMIPPPTHRPRYIQGVLYCQKKNHAGYNA